jgi:hypothetical protein
MAFYDVFLLSVYFCVFPSNDDDDDDYYGCSCAAYGYYYDDDDDDDDVDYGCYGVVYSYDDLFLLLIP